MERTIQDKHPSAYTAPTITPLFPTPKMSLIERPPNPSLGPCPTIDNDAAQYSEISCAPMDPKYGFTAATALHQVSELQCSYNPTNHSIRIRWPDGVTNWTREIGQPSGSIRGAWATTFIPPSGDKDKAENSVLVEVGQTMFELDNSPAEFHRDRTGRIQMDIYDPTTQEVYVRVIPNGDGTTIAEIAASPSHDGFTMKQVAAEQSQSPFIFKSLRNGTRKPGEDIVIPDGQDFKGLSIWPLWVESRS
jgi:hypothetical protein